MAPQNGMQWRGGDGDPHSEWELNSPLENALSTVGALCLVSRFFSRATPNYIFIFFLFLKLKLRFFARFFLPKSLLSRFASRASCFES
jgi:hypothetical protein